MTASKAAQPPGAAPPAQGRRRRPMLRRIVIGYRIVNYWLPLLPGTIAYLRLRLSPAKAAQARPPASPAG